MDEADAELAEATRREREGDGRAGELQLSGVRGVEAGQDLDERGLAGSVLAEQAVDLTAEDRQIGLAECLDAAEMLADATERQRGRLSSRPRVGTGSCYFSPQSAAYSSR